jgi:hypothetical protein
VLGRELRALGGLSCAQAHERRTARRARNAHHVAPLDSGGVDASAQQAKRRPVLFAEMRHELALQLLSLSTTG